MAIATAALALSACASTFGAQSPLEASLDVIGGPPRVARDLRKLPLAELPAGPMGWNWYEIGRRFETGDRAPQDLRCAVVFYEEAAHSRYESPESLRGMDYKVNRLGVPFAKVALRHLRASEAEVNADDPQRCARIVATAGQSLPAKAS